MQSLLCPCAYLSSEDPLDAQLIRLTQGMPESAARVELVVGMYSRVVDMENFYKVVYALEALEQSMLCRRLGESPIAEEKGERRSATVHGEPHLFAVPQFTNAPCKQ